MKHYNHFMKEMNKVHLYAKRENKTNLNNLPIKMSPDKVVDLLFVDGMQVLELVDGTEFDHIQSIGDNHI